MRPLAVILALLLCRPAWAGDCTEEHTALTGVASPCDGITVPFDDYGQLLGDASALVETTAGLEVCVESTETLERRLSDALNDAAEARAETADVSSGRSTWVVVALAVGVVLGSAGAFSVAAAVR